jgi:rhodanese-related sulfurtransferase
MAIKQQKPRDAHETLKNNPGAVYLDVRTEREFEQSHPQGALNVPVVFIKGPGQMEVNDDFVAVVEKNLPKNTKLIVGCMAGGRSQRGCEMLEAAGYTDLTNVVGGFGGQRDQSGTVVVKGWAAEELPVSSEVGEAGYQAMRKKAGM